MKNLEELEKKYQELGKEIEKLKAEPEEYTMYLKLDGGDLDIRVTGSGVDNGRIGYITIDGCCRFINSRACVLNYNLWLDNGMKVNTSSIEWRGKKYHITSSGSLRCNMGSGNIYDFQNAITYGGCEDDNLARLKNGRVILF